MKTIKHFLFTVAMLLCSTSLFAEDFDVDGIYYIITSSSDKTVGVTYRGESVFAYSNEYSGSVSIPESVTYNGTTYSVTSIGHEAFYDCDGLTSVTIPNSVTSIGSLAFCDCDGLTSVTIPNSVMSIGGGAFGNTPWYNAKPDGLVYINNVLYTYKGAMPSGTTIEIKEGTISISPSAFYECSGLTSVIIPNSVTSIGSLAFYDCDGLTSVTIPNSVTSIGNNAFYECSGLTSVTIPNSVTSIGGGAFADTPWYNAKPDGLVYINNVLYKYKGTMPSGTTIEIKEGTISISSAFYDCDGLTSVIIPNSVTSIGSSAFGYCSGLTSIEIPNSVISIGESTFYGCSGLTSVIIPNSVTSIGSSAFGYCSGLTSIEIPNSVTSIGSEAFIRCSDLTSVTIPNSVTSIGSLAFYDCDGLTSVTIPNSVTSIGSGAFEYCSGLTSVTIGNSVTSIGSEAFIRCSGLTSVTIPNSVISIGERTFYGCSGLTSVTIGNSVTSIGSGAFENCYNLRTVGNNSNLVIVKGSSSYGYVGFYAYRILSGENINGYYFDENNGEYTLIGYCGDETNLVLPENYKGNTYSISYNAFYGCSLKSLTIGTGVLSIGSDQCKPIKTIWLTNTPPSGYKNLQGKINYVANDQYSGLSNVRVYPYLSSAFETDGVKYVPVSPAERTCDAIDCSYDSDVVDINIGETVSFKGVEMKVQNVMPYTVYGQTSVKTLSVSHSGDIGDNAFYGCTGITDATISNEGNIGGSAFEGAMTSGNAVLKVSNKGNISNKAFYGCTGITDATISNEGNIGGSAFYGCTALKTANVENKGVISSEAFRGCTALETLTLGENVTSIGGSAFRDCSKLFAVTIPNKTTSLGSYSFAGCTLLKQLDLGNGVQSIGEYSFNGCSALPSIDIPASVTSVGDYTFKGCTSIADVVIKDRTTDLSLGSNGSSPLFADCPLDSVYIGGNISYSTSSIYGYSPFYRNTSLRSVVITDKEEEISDNEFYGCTNLKNVSIGSNVKKIGNWAFSGCSNLDYFSFGKSVESIGEEAFSDCVNMTQLISHAVTPPTCGTQALDDINKWNCTLKIPEGTNSAYMAANQWKEFFFMENIPAAINGVVMDGEDADKDAPVYNMHGVRMQNTDNLPAGIYIINGKKYLVR